MCSNIQENLLPSAIRDLEIVSNAKDASIYVMVIRHLSNERVDSLAMCSCGAPVIDRAYHKLRTISPCHILQPSLIFGRPKHIFGPRQSS